MTAAAEYPTLRLGVSLAVTPDPPDPPGFMVDWGMADRVNYTSAVLEKKGRWSVVGVAAMIQELS